MECIVWRGALQAIALATACGKLLWSDVVSFLFGCNHRVEKGSVQSYYFCFFFVHLFSIFVITALDFAVFCGIFSYARSVSDDAAYILR